MNKLFNVAASLLARRFPLRAPKRLGIAAARGSAVLSTLGCSLIVATIALFVTFVAWLLVPLAGVSSIDGFLQDVARPIYWAQLHGLRFWVSPIVLIVIPCTLLLTVAFPADRAQPVFSRGLVQDMTWALSRSAFTTVLLAAYSAFLIDVFHQYFHWMIFRTSFEWPILWRVLIGHIASDFLYWVRHVAMHKVPAFWHFHAVHHSQRQLNPFTIDRAHPVEFMITLNIWFIPMYALTTSLDVVVGYYLFRRGYDAFVHSNIGTNLGPLKYLLVTPQSHRVHHSRETRHYDANFGATLSIWDYLFGTQHRKYDEYPETGVSDPRFPDESAANGPFVTLTRQLFYPFRALRDGWFSVSVSADRTLPYRTRDERAIAPSYGNDWHPTVPQAEEPGEVMSRPRPQLTERSPEGRF